MSHQTQVLIPPYSLHKNWGEKNSPWTYKAIYINSNIVKKLAKQLKLDYAELASSPYFINRSKTQLEVSENSILKTLTSLLKNIDLNKKQSGRKPQKSLYLDELLEYISIHYNSKVTLDSLEDEFKVNKFSLLRNFKNKIGISPLEYQMSIRIEKSKQLFFEDIPLTHIALDSGFFDQSHFTHNFKKYVGVTPGEFKSNCNILQDIEKLVL